MNELVILNNTRKSFDGDCESFKSEAMEFSETFILSNAALECGESVARIGTRISIELN